MNSAKAPPQGDTDNLPSDALSPFSSPPSPSIPLERYPFIPITSLGSIVKYNYLLRSKSHSVSLIEKVVSLIENVGGLALDGGGGVSRVGHKSKIAIAKQ